MSLPRFSLIAPSQLLLRSSWRVFGCLYGTWNGSYECTERFPDVCRGHGTLPTRKLYTCVKGQPSFCKTNMVDRKHKMFLGSDFSLFMTRGVEMMSGTDWQKEEKEKQDKTVQTIIEILKTKDDFSLTMSDEQVLVSCIKHLFSLRLSPGKIEEFFTTNPEIFRQKDFIPTTEFLYRYGLQGKRICRLLTKYPQILNVPRDTIQTSMENLRELGFRHAGILLVLEGSPEIVHVQPKEVAERVKELKVIFKSKDVFDLIIKTPQVVFDDWDTIIDKFNYVFFHMGITQRQIMYSSLFKHSLRHVERRHVFLERAGFFRRWKKKTGEKNPNPELEDIIDLSDKFFAQKFGGMSLMDYETFCRLFEKEIKEQQQVDLDGETESDYEDSDDEDMDLDGETESEDEDSDDEDMDSDGETVR